MHGHNATVQMISDMTHLSHDLVKGTKYIDTYYAREQRYISCTRQIFVLILRGGWERKCFVYYHDSIIENAHAVLFVYCREVNCFARCCSIQLHRVLYLCLCVFGLTLRTCPSNSTLTFLPIADHGFVLTITVTLIVCLLSKN